MRIFGEILGGGKDPSNRLFELLKIFAKTHEYKFQSVEDGQVAIILIQSFNRWITCQYIFSPTEDSYEWVAVLGKVKKKEIGRLAKKIVTEMPVVPGVVERIIEKKLVILGKQDRLGDATEFEVRQAFMDDVARIDRSYGNYRPHL